MIRRITDIASRTTQAVLQLRLRFLAEHPHEIFTPMEQLVASASQGMMQLFSLENDAAMIVGYALLHPYHWGGTPVVWLDEIYLHPDVRGQGLFAEFINWLGQYCATSGVPTVMTNVWTKAEGLPFSKHVGAQSVVMTLRMTNPVYRATVKEEVHEQYPDPDTSGNGQPKAPRKKPAKRGRPRTTRKNDAPDRPRYPEGLAREVSE